MENHIQVLLRILAIQFEDGRKDKNFDAGIRIILHLNTIHDILHDKSYNFYKRLQQLTRSPFQQQYEQDEEGNKCRILTTISLTIYIEYIIYKIYNNI